MLRVVLVVVVLVAVLAAAQGAAAVTYLGKAEMSGTGTDLSGLVDILEEGTPHNRLGGHGSAIDYTGTGAIYVMCADRGPADGAASYRCRLQFVEIPVERAEAGWSVRTRLVSTLMLHDSQGNPFLGSAAALEDDRRFDPEGVRVSTRGTFFVSDEYGPSIVEFDSAGRAVRRIPVPVKFAAEKPAARPEQELALNRKGRQPNRGMEGLAISPDGRTLWGVMQSPLLQDGALDDNGRRAGINVRILRVDSQTLQCREYVYQLDDPSNGISEILAVDETRFLVIERDGKAGAQARFKRIVMIDTAGATDVSGVQALPRRGLPDGVVPVRKSCFLDLLSDDYGLRGESFPEKIEGLAFGPNLPDGRRLLLVTSDNDFVAGRPTCVYAFAVDPEDLNAAEHGKN